MSRETSRDLFERAKRTVRVYIVGAQRMRPDLPMHESARFYWRCRATALLRRAIAARRLERIRAPEKSGPG